MWVFNDFVKGRFIVKNDSFSCRMKVLGIVKDDLFKIWYVGKYNRKLGEWIFYLSRDCLFYLVIRKINVEW